MLRNYQNAILDAVVSGYKSGVRRGLVASATGTGKTVVFANLPTKMAEVLPGNMLVLAHREELIKQAAEKMQHWNPELHVSIEMADQYADPHADVIVSSVATLGRKGNKRIDRFPWDKITKGVCDEAHHSVAQTYVNIFERGGWLSPESSKFLLGVTATPNRGDGKALAKVYDKILYTYSMRDAINDGWLVDVRGYKATTDTNLDEVHTVGGDFAQDELADAVNNPVRNQLVVAMWMKHAIDRQTIVFTVDIKHAQDLAAMFRHYGLKAEAIWGDDKQRAEKLAAHKAGEIQILTNCGVLTEGYDDWRIACVVMARPTKSSALFQQMIGRGTRLQDGTGNLFEAIGNGIDLKKIDCLLIDIVDTSRRHSLITLPTLLGMDADLDLNGRSVVKSAKRIEDARDQNPHIDFSKLKNIDELDALIESVNLWDIKYPPEVEMHSNFTWHGTNGGGFALLMPQHERIEIKQNMLDNWEIAATINGQRYKGERATLEEAFKAADNLVTSKASSNLKILKRYETWHDDPVSDGQLKTLRRLFKGKDFPPDLTKGRASRIISNYYATH